MQNILSASDISGCEMSRKQVLHTALKMLEWDNNMGRQEDRVPDGFAVRRLDSILCRCTYSA